MKHKRSRAASLLADSATSKLIAAGATVCVSPNRGCWHCEQPLPLEPSAVVATDDKVGGALLWLICSPQCANLALEELASIGVNALIAEADEAKVLLSALEDPLVILGWPGADRLWCMTLTRTAAREELARLTLNGRQYVH